VQIVIADVDGNGRALSTSTSFALSGQVRAQGEGDDSLNRLATKAGREPEPFPPMWWIVLTLSLSFFLSFSAAQCVELFKMIRSLFLGECVVVFCNSSYISFIP
jgi:hypothetical protein